VLRIWENLKSLGIFGGWIEREEAKWVGGYSGEAPLMGEEWDMDKVTVNQILAEAKALSRDEQQQLRDALDAWLRAERLEEQLEHMLYDAGLLREIRPMGAATVSSPRCPPVSVRGQPVSETLIEARR
jgi:hypothetical protein